MMSGKAKYIMAVLLIAVGWGAFYVYSPQRALARRLKAADHVIFACNVQGYENLSTTVSGTDVRKIVSAIATAKKESPLVEASPAFRLEFFKGARRLASVTNSDLIFWIGKRW